jgi:hypothetical protein
MLWTYSVIRAHGRLVATWLLLSSTTFAAERSGAPFRVEYATSKICESSDDFSPQLLQRSHHVRHALPDEPGVVFRIEFFEEKGALRGRLTLRELDGRETARVVPGVSCEEVVAALALIAAVLIDPSAPVDSPHRAPARPPVDDRSRADTRTAPRDSKRSMRLGFGAGVSVLVQSAVAPDPNLGMGVEANTTLDSGGWLSPLFAVAANRTLTDTATTPNGTAQLSWWALRASACPVRWPERRWLALRPCALFDIGQLNGSGENTERRAESSGMWLAAGASGRVEAFVLQRLSLLAEGGILAPLRRDRFYFDPDSETTTAFEVPELGALARFAVVAHFE